MNKSKLFNGVINWLKDGLMPLLPLMLLPMLILVSCDKEELDTPAPDKEEETDKTLVVICADNRVIIVESTTTYNASPEIVWSWSTTSSANVPANYNATKFATISECKPANEGKQIAISSSSGAIGIINKEDKSMSFYAEVPNAHSIEILPGGLVVAAASVTDDASVGNKIILFDLETAELLQTHELYSAHGLVWDATRNSLFALGGSVLREYKLKDKKLSLNYEWKISGSGGHDLTMAPDNEKLYVTEDGGAWQFDLTSKAFTKIPNFPDAKQIKSIQQNSDGRFVFTVAEDSWWTYHVSFSRSGGSLSFPNMRVYKARWFNF